MTSEAAEIRCEHKAPARPRLEFWAIDRLIPSPRNARTHSQAQTANSALRMLTNLDRAALAAYCGAYALWAEATRQSRSTGR